jgi:hypothetical protein
MPKQDNEPIAGVIYDKNGRRVYVTNVDIYTLEMSDKLLVNSYRNTIYQNALFLEVEWLKANNIPFNLVGDKYEPELINNALNSMQVEILDRFGKDYFEELQVQIKEKDLAFLKQRPEK